MVASVRRLAFCELHYEASLQAYNEYKTVTKQAMITFAEDDLRNAATLRTNFTNTFTKGEPDHCAHTQFVKLLLDLLKHPQDKRKREFDIAIVAFNVRHGIDV
jgi:hypothetical protein